MGTFGDASDIISSTVDKIVTTVNETQDAFIFSTLSSYAAEQYNITVEKEELVRAIQLIRMSREYGPSIGERWATATQNAAELDRAYKKGLQDGMRYLANRVNDPKYIDSILSHGNLYTSNCYIEKCKRFLDIY